MSEQTLYRKYRPHTFKDVVGQDHIVGPISEALKNKTFSHAYLFSGTRGTGKTSIARIIASELGVSQADLYEIDAASNRGIDDIRELRESVQARPFDSEYKVYIIDEVHMLTKEAFNALLKTLEEPPAHTVFVLATTEFEKLPDTIVSRCETYQFKQPGRRVLADVVKKIAKKEGYSIEQPSAELIALLGNGSFRDSLGILQKVIHSSSDKKISPDEVETIVGAPRGEKVNNCIRALVEGDLSKALELISSLSKNNIDIRVFTDLLLEKIRFILLLRFKAGSFIKDDVSEEDFVFLEEMSKRENIPIKSETIIRLIDASTMFGIAATPELPLELAFIDIIKH